MTEKKHRSVILFGEWQRPLGALSLEQKGMLLDALLAYPEGSGPISPTRCSGWRGPLWKGPRRECRKWEETRQRRAEAGTKGAESRWHSEERGKNSKCHAPMAKMAVSGSDSVSDTGSASDSESEPDIVSRMGRLTALTRPSRPRASPIFVRRTRVKSGTTLSGRTERRLRPTGSGRSMNPTAGGWARTPWRNWQAAATVWMARDRERPAPAETYVPKNKAFYATRPPEQAKDFLKDAA